MKFVDLLGNIAAHQHVIVFMKGEKVFDFWTGAIEFFIKGDGEQLYDLCWDVEHEAYVTAIWLMANESAIAVEVTTGGEA